MAKARGLGKSIFDTFDDNLIESKKGAGEMLKISSVEPRRDQPRKTFERESLESLAESIQKHGVLQPIIVRESAGGFYQIIAGERRWRASKLAGLLEVPVIIMEADALKAAEIAIIENIQREDLNPYEEAAAYQALMHQYNLTQEQVSEKVGKSRSAIANTMRLLDLPEEVLEMLKTGDISAGHARALLAMKDKDAIVDIAKKILTHSLNVRDTEALVKKLNKIYDDSLKQDKNQQTAEADIIVNYSKDLENRAMSLIGKRVKIIDSGKHNKFLQVEYIDNEDLEELLVKICGEGIKE